MSHYHARYKSEEISPVKSGHASTTIDLSRLWCHKLEIKSWWNEKAQDPNLNP